MNSFQIFRRALFVVALVAVPVFIGLTSVQSEEPVDNHQFVLLKTGRVLEGDLVQSLDRWTLHMEAGATIRLEIDQIDLLGDSLIHLYQQQQQRTVRDDLRGRVRIVNFCIRNQLLDQARLEIEWLGQDGMSALESERLLASVAAAERQAANDGTRSSAPSVVNSAQPETFPSSEGVQESEPRKLVSVDEIDPEEFSTFVRFAQPHLLRGCTQAACHGPQSAGEFRFERLERGASPTRKMSQKNYLMIRHWLEENSAERLTLMATTAHGGDRDPTWQQNDLGINVVEAWVKSLSLKKRSVDGFAGGTTSEVRPASFVEQVQASSSSETAEAPSVSNDPYDPAVFNFHAWQKRRAAEASRPTGQPGNPTHSPSVRTADADARPGAPSNQKGPTRSVQTGSSAGRIDSPPRQRRRNQ